ncbi:histidinol dehydrogenase [Pseudomonas typographi]|uniref:histidinol dehydrogenase n=1 Tax=Pseudomonas typographi TaxID=2715964 RepID=UPI0016864C28|nr:histidinol dehydrogenase [Pseudomonas typographi]MBD1550213.1 histidinol dehydrogenase [Pseudomonas typographi]MBD1586027.1 histidinol dehydrogenase [Pseudomonas typographi]
MKQPTFHDLTTVDVLPPKLFKRTEADLSFFAEKVKPIIEAVRTEGDAALVRFAKDFDRVTASTLSIRAEPHEFDAALARMDPKVVDSIRYAADNIRAFHTAQKPEDMWLKEMRPGAFAGDRHVPIDSVACYVPRGKGSFPSVLLMTAIPAIVAGVPRPIVITPPGPDGTVDDATLVAARLVGIEEVYKCGGAQGVAAVAYGTQTVPKCLKVVGPGSPWVVSAKRQLSHLIDPGTPAGPSESVVLADHTANPSLAALDLIIESEHGPDSSAYLVTNSRAVAEGVMAALPGLWAMLDPQRAEFSQAVLCGEHGGIVLTNHFDTAVDWVNEYAPEHLEILAEEPMAVMTRIRNAGEILLGNYTPVTLGNFVLGPNAVLPTNGAAKTAGPLSVFDYMKRISVGYVTRAGYDELAEQAHGFALYEGFSAHALAVSPLRKEIIRNGQ